MDAIYSAISREQLVELLDMDVIHSAISWNNWLKYLDFFHVFVDFIPELLLIFFTSTTLFLVKKFLKHIDKNHIFRH